MTASRSVHATYRGVARERWLATRRRLPGRSAKGTLGKGGKIVLLADSTAAIISVSGASSAANNGLSRHHRVGDRKATVRS